MVHALKACQKRAPAGMHREQSTRKRAQREVGVLQAIGRGALRPDWRTWHTDVPPFSQEAEIYFRLLVVLKVHGGTLSTEKVVRHLPHASRGCGRNTSIPPEIRQLQWHTDVPPFS